MANAIKDPMDRLSEIIQGEKSPFVELSERMKETSKDVKNLNMSILDLAIAIEQRAGVKTDKKDTKEKKEKEPEFRNFGVDLKADLKDFAKGFVSTFTTNSFAEHLIGKSEMPANVEKPTISNIEDTVETIKPADNTTVPVENKDPLETDQPKELPNQNKILADMVAVLIDLRDDKSQKQLLGEAIAIKKLITDQSNTTKLSGGIEPNNEEAKQEDREKLAEAIARKLADVLEGMGDSSLFGLGPDVDTDNKKKPGGKTPPAKVQGRGGVRIGGPLAAGMIGYELATAGDEVVDTGDPVKDPVANANNAGLKAIREKLLGKDTPEKEISVKESLSSGEELVPAMESTSSKTSKKVSTKELKNVNKLLNEQQETQKDKLKDAPWYTKMFGVGKEDYLKTLPVQKTQEEEAKEWMQRQEEASKMYPNKNTSPKIPAVTPKPTESSAGKLLNEVSDENTKLKMFNIGEAPTRSVQPIISQTTVNNKQETMLAAVPTPHSSSSSYNKWQAKRSSYTD